MKRMSRRMKRMIAVLVVEVLIAVNVLTAYADEAGQPLTFTDAEVAAMEQSKSSVDEQPAQEELTGQEESGQEEVAQEEETQEEASSEEPQQESGEETSTEDTAEEETPTDTPADTPAVDENLGEGTEEPTATAEVTGDAEATPTAEATEEATPSATPEEEAMATATPSAEPTATPGAAPELMIEDNSVAVTGTCVAAGNEIAESFTISVSDVIDLATKAPEVEGYTFTGKATLADGTEVTLLKKEVTETETSVKTVMSYMTNGTWVELTEDITIEFEYAAVEDESKEASATVNFYAVYEDTAGNAIAGYEKTALSVGDSLDLTTEPIAIEGYNYLNAKIDNQIVNSLEKKINIDENGTEVVSYSYTTDAGTTVVTNDVTVTFVYAAIAEEPIVTLAFVDEEGSLLAEATEAEFETKLVLDNPEAAPAEIEGYVYKEAYIGEILITALTKTVDEATGNTVVSYVTAEETVAVEADTTIVLVYEKEAVVVDVNVTCVDEFGDTIADKYTEMELPAFTDDALVLDDVKNPPVKDISKWKSLFKVVKYTYVKASIGSEIITGLKREVTADTADLKDSKKEYIYSYTTDGTNWTKIQEDTTIMFSFSGGSKTTYTYEDSQVLVVATLQHAGAIPDDAEFKVTSVTASTSGYSYDAYMDALNENAKQIASDAVEFTDENTLMYDIAFLAPELDADGNVIEGSMVEYQPAEGMVSISFTFKQSQVSEELAVEKASDVTVVHLPLEDAVKESTATTADATDISASDVKVEVVDATVSLNGNTDQVDFCAAEFSMYVWVNHWTGDRTYLPGAAVTYSSVLGSAVNYGIVANEIAHSAHMDTNFATSLLSGSAQTTAGEYTGNHNPGDFIIAEYSGKDWFTNCANATRPFVIYTTEDAKAKFNQNIYDNTYLVIDTNSSKAELTAQVDALISGVDSTLAAQNGYTPSQIMEYTQGENGVPDQKYLIDLTHSGSGTYYVNFSEGEFSQYFDQASRVYIKMYEDQNIVFNIPDATVNLQKFEMSVTSRPNTWSIFLPTTPQFVGSDISDERADKYAQKLIFNMPNATSVNAQSSIVGVVLCPKADFYIGSTSTGWLVANKVTNGGEWHGVWQDMPDSVYIPAATNMKAQKTVNGETPTETFTFKLEKLENGSWVEEETKQNDGSEINFSDITYSEEGTYYYRISEVKGDGDYEYDTTVYVAEVVVTSSTTTVGSLTTTTYSVASTAYYKGSEQADAVADNKVAEAGFNNTKIEKGAISVTKILVGTTADTTFYFVVKDSAGEQVGEVRSIKNGATVIIDELALGDYTVVETDADGNAVVSDSEGFPYTVTAVTQNVTVTAGNTSAVTITNTYDASGEADFSATKTLNGLAPVANAFSFELKDANGNVLQTKSNAADGSVDFDEISYTLADVGNTYTYTISEVIPTDAVDNVYNGYTYDDTVYTYSVKIEDNGDGTLKVIKTGDADVAAFANTYATKGSLTLVASKTLNDKAPKNGQFTFTLTGGEENQTKTNDASGKVEFDQITYTQDDLAKSPITYTVSEKNDGVSGYTYDSSVYTVTVTLEDNGDGTITATPSYMKVKDSTETSATAMTFTNTYEAVGRVVLTANKNLVGRDLEANQFAFELKDADGNVIQTAYNDAGGNITFAEIIYNQDQVGEYNYTISEKVPTGDDKNASYSYDTSVTNVKVTVKDDGAGNVTATAEYTGETAQQFTNYYTAEGAVSFRATKSLTGSKTPLAAEQFSFVLKNADGDVIETVSNAADGEILFSALKYNQDDVKTTFTYTIEEVIPEGAVDNVYNGTTYDATVYTVTVTLTDDGNGKIVATPVYKANGSDKSAMVFNNTYKADGEVTLKATKELVGRDLAAGQFEFALTDAQGNVLQTATNAIDGTVSFKTISYDQSDAGITYTYYIKEVIPETKAEGYTYDEASVEVTVVVTDNHDGTLTATETYAGGSAKFTNYYDAAGKVDIEATKTLIGKDLADKQFTFELRDAQGNVLQTVQNDADGNIDFAEIEYTEEDLKKSPITYTVNEKSGDEEGYQYDGSEFAVIVTLTDDGKGNITAAKTINKNNAAVDAIEFENIYTAEGEVVITATKALTGSTLTAEQFSFVLKNAEGKEIETVQNAANGNITFAAIKYSEKDAGKTFTYTISEVKGSAAGYDYDETIQTVTVKVTDGGNGKLTAEASYSGDGAKFINDYDATGELQLKAKKVLNGRALEAGQFSFELIDSGNNVIQTKTNDANGNVTFDKLSFNENQIGTDITYRVKEVYADAQGYTYDRSIYTVTVALEDNGDGTLKVTDTYVKVTPDSTEDANSIIFTNAYEAVGKVDLVADKTLSGKNLTAGQFSFELKDSTDKVLQTIKNDADGNVVFNTITYTQEDAGKTFEYTISEVNDGKAGYTYDSTVKKVTVTVEDNGDGTLKVTPVYADGTASFTNTYAANGAITFSAEKTLTGSTLKEGQFSFTLTGDGVNQTKTNDANGKVTFDQISYTQDDLEKGQITYTVSEVNTGEAGYTYDGTVYTVTVTLTDNGDGTITAAKSVSDGTSNVKAMSFANTYHADGAVILEAHKTLEGRAIEDEQFSFTLTGDGVSQTKTNKGSTVIFDEIAYSAADAGKTFTYTIEEVNDGKDGYTYDATVRTVTVSVVDNGDGTLTATPTYDDGSNAAQFTNAYEATGEITLGATKTLKGRNLEAGQFSFTLTGDGVNQTKTNDAGGAVTFDTISYTEDDLAKSPIEYTVREVVETKDGYTYDEAVYTVKVTLVDNGNGTITATPSYEKDGAPAAGPAFTNTYTANGSVQLKADKTLTGRALTENQFSFELKDAEGTVLQTKTNDESGAVVFDEISYTTADIGQTYTYTINEVNDGAEGYEYDEAVKTVTVTITDNGNGKLIVTPSYEGGSASFVNTYEAKGSVTLSASKTLTGRKLEDAQFSFVLKDANNNLLQTVENAADGTITFAAIDYTEADLVKGAITYTVSEVIETKDGYTYDTTVYEVSVALKDNGDGTITATPTITNKATKSDVTAMEFVNKYVAEGTALVEANKTLENRVLEEKQFSFELRDEAGTLLQTKTNTAAGKVVFDPIEYTTTDIGQTYTYTIHEVNDGKAGYAYDTAVKTVTVVVEDNGDGTIKTTVSYTGDDNTFKNTYTANGNVTFGATKTLTGRTLEEGQFSFQLKDASGKVIQTKTNTADGAVAFEQISYTEEDIKNSPIKYSVNEVVETKVGYTYDNSVYTVEVTLTDNGDGTITATPAYSKGNTSVEKMEFSNTYTADGEIILIATKDLTGRTLKDGQFSFELKDVDGKVLQTKTNVGRTVTFEKIIYDVEDAGKNFKYTISEVNNSDAGYTYDEAVYEVIVSVTDDGTGALKVEADYTNGAAEFKNAYKAEGSVVLDAKKTLEGKKLADGQFSFVLKDAAGNELQTKTNTAEGTVTFDEINYTEADLAKSPITYTVSEVNAGEAGYTYATDVYTVTVTLTDNGDGTITAAKSYNSGEELTFVNTYAAEGEVILTAKKDLAGRTLADGQFSFELKDEEGTVLQTKKNDGSGNITFDKIIYSEADAGKTFNYTISEVNAGADGYTYDATVYNVTVTVTDGGNGQLITDVSYINGAAEFKNTYKAEGSVVLDAKKTLAGKKLADGQFSFVLKDAAGNELQTKTNTAEGTVTFDEINYTEADLAKSPITYTVSEVNAGEAGYTYATDIYTVTVTLTDNGDGTIAATKSYSSGEELAFTNTYAAKGEIVLTAKKALDGRTLAEGQFSFELKDEAGTVLQTKKNDGSGNITFDKIIYSEADAGKTFNYTISEVDTGADGYTYDATVYNVTVTVTDSGNGQLVATADYVDGSAVFTNTYAAKGAVVIEATKNLTGRALAANQFSFVLKDAAGNELQTKTNTAEGKVTFDEINYTEADLAKSPITYTVSEVNAGADGYTYDANVYTVTVTLTDNGDGTITAAKSYDGGEELVFANTYAAEGEVVLKAAKALEGRALADGQFSFELKDEAGTVLQTKKNDGRGNVVFDKITYNQEDAGKTFCYTINEVAENEAGYTYDTTVYNVEVVVTDNGDGKLTATETYTNGPADFENIYEAKGSVFFEAMKLLEDRVLEAGQFEFELKDASGTVLQTKKNFSDGSIIFDVINFTQEDLKKEMPLVYTISEVIPADEEKAPGYTYDSRSFTVEVTLKDNGDGTIEATPVYVNVEDGTVPAFTNIYNAEGEITLKAEKTLENRTLEADQFTFKLLDESGKTLDTKKNDGTGLVTFDPIKYKVKDAGKTFEYTIVEVDGKKDGYTYDVTEHKVTVTVEDAGDGTLSVTATYDEGEAASFTNTYKAEGSIELEAKKVLENRKLEDGQFSFVLKDAAGNEIETVVNNGSKVKFSAINFTEADLQKDMPLIYTISEVTEGKDGYTYDTSIYTVEITLEDKGNGTIDAKAVYKKNGAEVDAVFTNVYSAEGEAVIVASKTLQNKTLKDKQFSFELKDADGNVLQTKTNDGNGAIVFDPIQYQIGDAGKTFTYTINEVIESVSGYTYDSTVHTVYVQVEDQGNGVLLATISYEGGAAEFVNKYTPDKPTPTPTPTTPSDDEPTPTPNTPNPTATPTVPDEEVLGAYRTTEGEVLGARRGTDRAVLGKRRRPATGDSMALILWVLALAGSVGTALTSVVMMSHNRKKK